MYDAEYGNISSQEKKEANFLDEKEFTARFLLEPDINLGPDYDHLDKNLAITKLIHNPRLGIDEPNKARAILQGLHVLNLPKYYMSKEVDILMGYKSITGQDKEGNEVEINIPVYKKKLIQVPKYPKTFHRLRSQFISFVNTAAASGGHRISAAFKKTLVREESLTEKTEVKTPNTGFMKSNYNNRR